mmetsp:Transcript_17589/g.40870  ORF Transcript_17589/g.40870 Transcript_17589/m.40870 type:complete len:108 (-) Transcript_17589:340-663(-)
MKLLPGLVLFNYIRFFYQVQPLTQRRKEKAGEQEELSPFAIHIPHPSIRPSIHPSIHLLLSILPTGSSGSWSSFEVCKTVVLQDTMRRRIEIRSQNANQSTFCVSGV